MLTLGAKLGPYEIVSPLGAGGMGEVYRAKDARLERTVAIKILPAEVAKDAVRKQRFEREAKTISSLNHPNICTLHDIGSQDGTDYLVMECVEGETLAKRLEKGPLQLEQTLKYGAQIADALDKAHRSGVVHRDLKPGNIMLTPTGAKLLDFGLAKPAVPLVSGATLTATVTPTTPVTQEGTIVGTFQYMSPEQVEGKEVDGRSDIFSLGALLYEMVTGTRAFEGKSQLSVASAILEKEPAPISTIKPMTPPALDHVIRKCLAKTPDDRWQSAADIKHELAWISQTSAEAVAFSTGARKTLLNRAQAPALGALVVAALTLFLLRPRNLAPVAPTYAFLVPPRDTSFQFEGDTGAPPVLSPDGSGIVFGAGDELWYRSLRNGTERLLVGAHGASFPFWSPDSSRIGFFADTKLKSLDVATGGVRTLCDAPSARGGTWGSGGIILFSPAVRDVLYQVPAAGGSPSPVTSLDPKLHTTHRWPSFLPDGQHFLYLATNHSYPQAEQNGIFLASLDGRLNRLLVSSLAGGVYSQGNLLYVNQSSLYARPLDLDKLSLAGVPVPLVSEIVVDIGVWHATFSASQTNELVFQTGSAAALSRLEWVDRLGKHLSFINEKGSMFGLELSRDDRRIFVNLGDPSADTWAYDTMGQTKTRLSFDGGAVSEAVWSPDDSRFCTAVGLPNNRYKLLCRASNGSGPTTLIYESDDQISPTDWSPDGRYLLAERFLHGSTEMWIFPLNSKDPPRPLLTSSATKGFLQTSGQFSPDGRFMAFTLSTQAGPQVFVVPFPEGEGMWQVSPEGGRWPRWRRDGKELYFVSTRNVITAVDIREKGDGLEIGHPVPLFSFHPSRRTYRQGMSDYDVSRDGQRFLLNAAADENSRPLTLLLNWSAELKKK